MMGCSGDEAPLGVARQSTTWEENPAQKIAPTKQGSETSCAWVNTNASGSRWVCGFNDASSSSTSINGYVWATEGVPGSLPVWTNCNFGTGCGQSGNPVPKYVGARNQLTWWGDPVLVTTRAADGFAAYVSMARSDHEGDLKKNDMIVAALSFGGGTWFETTEWVNDGHCDGGTTNPTYTDEDQPAAFVDTTVSPPYLWVAWRHNEMGGTFGACLRGGAINFGTHHIDWLGPPVDIQNLDRQPFYGVGGLLVTGAFPRITVVYSNTDHSWVDCPDNNDKNVSWFSVSTPDFGLSWEPSVRIRETNTFTWCKAAGRVQNTLRAFGLVREAGGDYYAALDVSRSTIDVYRSTDGGVSWGAAPWKSFNDNTCASRFFPTLASDLTNRIAISFQCTDVATDTWVKPLFVGSTSASGNVWPDPPTTLAVAFQADPMNGTKSNRTLGDYNLMGARPWDSRTRLTYMPGWTNLPRPPNNVPGNERAMTVRLRIN